MQRIVLFATLFLIAFSCKENNSNVKPAAPSKKVIEKLVDKAGKVFPEKVYGFNKGKTGPLIFIIEGTKLYKAKKDGTKDDLFLEKIGNKVFEYSKGQIGVKPVFIFEGNKYWEADKNTSERGDLIFKRKGNDIYQITKGKASKTFVIQ